MASAMERANTTNTSVVSNVLHTETFNEIFGSVQFADTGLGGQNRQAILATQLYMGQTEIIAPIDVATAPMRFPAATWSQRLCSQKTTPECTGRGFCTDDGECLCEAGFDGELCEFRQRPTDDSIDTTMPLLAGSILGLMLLAMYWYIMSARRHKNARRMREYGTKTTPSIPELKKPIKFHLFLSHGARTPPDLLLYRHPEIAPRRYALFWSCLIVAWYVAAVWGTGQDQTHLIKKELLNLCPHLEIFLGE